MTELDGLIGAEEKVINSKNKVDENVVSLAPLFGEAEPAVDTHYQRCLIAAAPACLQNVSLCLLHMVWGRQFSDCCRLLMLISIRRVGG